MRYKIARDQENKIGLYALGQAVEGEILFDVGANRTQFAKVDKEANAARMSGVVFALKDIDSNEEIIIKEDVSS